MTLTDMLLEATGVVLLVMMGYTHLNMPSFNDVPPMGQAQCGSDTDCMRLCPPEDMWCDGGPEPMRQPKE